MIKLNWFRGRNLGLSLMYLGGMVLFQIIFIAIAQYNMEIGSRPVTALIPLGVALAMFYSILIIFEARTSMQDYRSKRRHGKKNKNSDNFLKKIWNNIYLYPVILIIAIFTVTFFLFLLLSLLFTPISVGSYVVASNAGGLACFIVASYMDQSSEKRVR